MRHVLAGDAALLLSVAPKLLAGSFIGAFVPLLLPREVVRRHVGGASGLRGLAVAAGVGAVLPGGPFTIFPVTAGLLAAGADAGAAVAFVTSWLLNGLMRTLVWELPFMGSHYVLARLPATLLLPLLGGLLARRLLRAVPELGRGLGGEGA